MLCLTAMHKDPARRYASAEALIRDVNHYLSGEPLEARADTLQYRAGKFVRRNWRAVTMATATIAMIIGLTAFYTVRLAKARNFYGSLPEMPDARLLFDAVKHLKPTILTGLPLGSWAAPQKVEWAADHFPGVPIITCMARDKHKHMHPGDVLVDDRENHRAAYEAAGVVFVHHKNADDSLRQLATIFPSVRAPG